MGGGGSELTVNVSEAMLPVFVVSRNRLPEVLLYVPLLAELTVTAIVQLPDPAIVIFENESGSLTVAGRAAPQPVYVTELLASVIPAGRSSVKLTPEIADVPGLLTVNVNVDVPPGRMVFGENAFVTLAFTILA